MRRSEFVFRLATVVLFLGSAKALTAQEGTDAGAAALHVPTDHWVQEALRRLDPLVQVGQDAPWGHRSLPRRDVLAVLDRIAAGTDPSVSPGVRELVSGYRDRFLEELGIQDGTESSSPIRWARGHGEAMGGKREGTLRPGRDLHDPSAPVPWRGLRGLQGSAGGAAVVGPLGLAGAVGTDPGGDPVVRELYLATTVRSLTVWAGRRAPGLGVGVGGAVILGGHVPLDGGGVALARAISLPWMLRHLGPLRFESHLSRMDESGDIGKPWFWAARGTVSPHPRLSLGANRGIMFGGDGSPPMTLRNLFHTFVGSRPETGIPGVPKSAFANQIASLELRWRVPLEASPLSFYIEWGLEDSAGSWLAVPGIVAGIHMPFVPGYPGLSVGLERTHFAPACCGNPPWYRHAHFTGGWSDHGIPLGHPLGGHGDEWLVHGRVDVAEARLRTGWRLFHRERGWENLYFPDRRGASAGGGVEARWRLRPSVDLSAEGFYERSRTGRKWDEVRAFVGLRAFF
jgi:hypothetical protein